MENLIGELSVRTSLSIAFAIGLITGCLAYMILMRATKPVALAPKAIVATTVNREPIPDQPQRGFKKVIYIPPKGGLVIERLVPIGEDPNSGYDIETGAGIVSPNELDFVLSTRRRDGNEQGQRISAGGGSNGLGTPGRSLNGISPIHGNRK